MFKMPNFLTIFAIVLSFGSCASSQQTSAADEQNSKVAEPAEEVVSNADLAVLFEDAVDWGHQIGFYMRSKEKAHISRSDIAIIWPFALFPSPFPSEAFQQATKLQKEMQLLQFRVARDYDFLIEANQALTATNSEIRNFCKILRDLRKEEIRQPITLLIQRSDYMLSASDEKSENGDTKYAIKQVEVNTECAGGGTLGPRITEIHRRMLEYAGMDASLDVVPENKSADGLGKGLYLAWNAFGDPNALVLFVVYRPANSMQFEDRQLEYELRRHSGYKAKVVRLSITEVAEKVKLADDFSLRLEGRLIGLVYHCTLSKSYSKVEHWVARKDIERSTAIKVPSIGLALSGSKKVQQYLSLPGMIERFFPNKEDTSLIAAIRSTYAGLWGLEHEDEKTMARIQDAKAHPERYVLKPDGGGGGNNFFDQAIVDKLNEFTPEKRAGHILMERLRPMKLKNYLYWPHHDPYYGGVDSELSVFGTLLGNVVSGAVLHNSQDGHFLRTKKAHLNEGGITTQGGVFDTPYLY